MAKREEVKAVFKEPGLKRRFKTLCAQEETDMSSVIEELVIDWCNKIEQESAQKKDSPDDYKETQD
ncbi:MAG: hypothetical protein F6J89_31565 [Symploca sp. SIO1C4]|uniref:CopG family transcriptional regulator n=1 Tax=Symploca sp. SIO1C4 TaxID=2607765 RepID=A0A6B3NJQ3_9CYAN|nr:hypothetical protein [Symploca sp. SIO1C4]